MGDVSNKDSKYFSGGIEIHDNIIIECAHRTKGKTTRNNTAWKSEPRTIVINLDNYKDKSMILRNIHKLKGSDNFINEDFSKLRVRRKSFGKR